MADDRHYIGGSYYRICDRTGFKVRAEKTNKQWNNRIVRDKSWEPRQPQDLVRGTVDDQSVSEPRPRQIDTFIGPLGTVTAVAANAGANSMVLQNSLRMYAGDTLSVMMGNGQNGLFTLTAVNWETGVVNFLPALPYYTPSNAYVVDITAYSQPDLYESGGTDD